MFFLVNVYLLESFHKKILILAGPALKLKTEQTIFYFFVYICLNLHFKNTWRQTFWNWPALWNI